MTYIIENANILKESQLVTSSLLVKENQFAFIGNHFKKYSFMKMNAEPYIMAPTFCIFDSLCELDHASFQQKKEYFLQNFIMKGCTTLLTYVEIKYDSELTSKLKNMKLALLNSPIDYIIGIKVPLNLLSPTLIRRCKREKIPAIFIELNENDDLSTVPWGWIREAMFPYNSLLIPIVSGLDNRTDKKHLMDWKNELDRQKIQHFDAPLVDKNPLTVKELCKLGIYPIKSSIIQGGEVNYNLYLKNRETKNIDVNTLFDHHNDKLLITVHKGVVIRVNKTEILYRSGFGEHVNVKMPSYFSIM